MAAHQVTLRQIAQPKIEIAISMASLVTLVVCAEAVFLAEVKIEVVQKNLEDVAMLGCRARDLLEGLHSAFLF